MCQIALTQTEDDDKRKAFDRIERLASRWMSDYMEALPTRSAATENSDARSPSSSSRVTRAWPPSLPILIDRDDDAEADEADAYEAEETTDSRPLVLALVEFQCPVCHQTITATDDRGTLRMPWHRAEAAIFPFGLGGPAHRMECPASLMEIAQVCDGDHRIPPCSDPECWRAANLGDHHDSEGVIMRARGAKR
jgi:hypothetical protein